MDFFPKKEIVESLRKKYPAGTRVELVSMNDPYDKNLVPGSKGTVRYVDDAGTIQVSWDCGSSLGICYGEDSCRKLDTVKTICYNEEKMWDSREEAISYFIKAMASTEGSERERYETIFVKLMTGATVASDNPDGI